MTFPRDAISEPTLIVVHRWKSRACSPQLQDNEAVVSNVIEFSTGSDEALEFKADVKLVLSHSAPNLHGYELVVFKLTDRETNEWENVAGIENFWSLSGKLSTVLFRSMLWRHVGRMVGALGVARTFWWSSVPPSRSLHTGKVLDIHSKLCYFVYPILNLA